MGLLQFLSNLFSSNFLLPGTQQHKEVSCHHMFDMYGHTSENIFFFNFIFPYLLCGSQYVEGLRLLKSRYLKQLTQFNKYSNQFVFSFPFRYSYPLNSLFIISTFSSFLWIVNIFNYRREFAEANEFLKK